MAREHLYDGDACWCRPTVLLIEPSGERRLRPDENLDLLDNDYPAVVVHNDAAGVSLGTDPLYLAEGTA